MAHLDLAIFYETLEKPSKICQIARASVHSPLQVAPQIFDLVLSEPFQNTFIFWWSHSIIDLDVCFGSLHCWKMKFFIFSFLAETWRFCFNIGIKFHLPWLRPQFQLNKKGRKAWGCCHHHTSLCVWCSFRDVQCLCQTYVLELQPQKVNLGLNQAATNFTTCFWETSDVLCILKPGLMSFFVRDFCFTPQPKHMKNLVNCHL